MAVLCTVRIDDYNHNKLIKLAKANKRNKSFYIREAIDDYLFDQEEGDIALARMKNPDKITYTTEEIIGRIKSRSKNV